MAIGADAEVMLNDFANDPEAPLFHAERPRHSPFLPGSDHERQCAQPVGYT